MLFRSPKPQTPNPKPQTPNPKPQTPYTFTMKIKLSLLSACLLLWQAKAKCDLNSCPSKCCNDFDQCATSADECTSPLYECLPLKCAYGCCIDGKCGNISECGDFDTYRLAALIATLLYCTGSLIIMAMMYKNRFVAIQPQNTPVSASSEDRQLSHKTSIGKVHPRSRRHFRVWHV